MNKPATNKERLHEDLKRRILTLDLEPGSSLDESKLSARYGLSRTPVRDVLRLLTGEGYLCIEENRGAFVAPMNHKTLRDFFITAPPIYASIAALAAENHKPSQLADLKQAQVEFHRATTCGDPEPMAYHNNQFHLIMGEMADNQYLWPSLQRLLIDHSRIAQTFYRPRNKLMQQRMELACQHHEQFITALENRDPQTARTLAYDHWQLSRDHLELFVRPDPLDIDISTKP